ncbi:MAG: aromatic ring-hydroxylating oxygenase subunit alpha [Myxococcota bacterium]
MPTSELLAEVIDCGRETAARALPFAAYTDPQLFELELEQIFRNEWIPICAEGSLAEPGDYLALELAREPLVVLRGKDGELRALSNSCRHRGTPIADPGYGKQLKLVCPYHAWAYDDRGRLRGAPHTGEVAIDRESHGLATFALDVWRGIVFVHLGREPKPLADRLAGIDPHLAGFDLDRFDTAIVTSPPEVWEANWKVVLENGLESYHLFQLHRTSLEPLLPTRTHSYLAGGRGWSITPGRRSDPASAEGWGSTDEFARDHYAVVGIPPSFYCGLTVEGWALLFVHPLTPERTLFSSALLVESGRELDFGESPFGRPDAQPALIEDREMCERVQRGMHSRAGRPGQLVELERILHDFHGYLSERLAAAVE